VVIGATVFAIAWPLRNRLRRPTALMWFVVALLAVGRFFEFFVRSDTADLALALEIAQWTSLALLTVVAAGAWLTLGHRLPLRPPPAARVGPGATRGGPEHRTS
jgi:prolipoprotein diacylglyceryltransferase